jgi:hypothetical protein
LAAIHAGHCGACLLEDAFTGPGGNVAGFDRALTIQMPLGESPNSAVFLVREHGPHARLLRLKTWRVPAPPGFLAAFERLRTRLRACRADGIDVPDAATIDGIGRGLVLSEFRQGLPIVGQVRSGRINVDDAIALLRRLGAAAGEAHAAGLVHESVGPGNVIADGRTGYLLDFGLTALACGPGLAPPSARGDLDGFAALERMVRESAARQAAPPAV